MKVGILRVEFVVPGPSSLKEKRRVVKSLKERLRSRFNVSAAEVDHQDLWQRTDLGVAVVSGSPGHVDRMLTAVQIDLDRRAEIEILGSTRSYLEEEER